MTTHINLAEEVAKHKLSRLVLNATEINGKVKEWRAINDAVRNILKIYRSQIVESQETKLALAISPLMADAPWDLSYAQLRAVVQNFRPNAQLNKPMPVPMKVGLVASRRAQMPQAIPRAVHFCSTTEQIPTATKDVHTVNLLKHTNMPTNCGKPKSSPRRKAPFPIRVENHVQLVQMDVDDEPPNSILDTRNLPSYRPTQGADGRAGRPVALPVPQWTEKGEARGRLTPGKPKQVADTDGSSGEEDNVESDKQQIGKGRRTLSESSSEVVPNPNDAKPQVQVGDNIRAPVPCEQCKKAGVECFTFPKIPRRPVRRVCTRCSKSKKGCSLNSGFSRGSKKNEELSSNTENVAKVDLMRQIPVTERAMDRIPPLSQEPARGDVTTRVTKVENLVNDLQDQIKIIRGNVVAMDSRIEDVVEGTKSMTRVMKRFETRSEQANRMIEKLVERVEGL